MKKLAILTMLILVGCGGNSSSSSGNSSNNNGSGTGGSNGGTVHASSFTNANLIGSFAFGIAGTSGATTPVGGSGVATADGNGNIASGEETVNIGGISCHSTFTGTYSVNANGTGSATVNVTEDGASQAKGCLGGTTNLSFAIGNAGSTLILADQDSGGTEVLTGIKQ